MRLPLLVVLIAATTNAAEPPPIRIASPGLKGVRVEAGKVTFYSDHLAQKLAEKPDLRCVTATEVANLIGLERQKQLLGCDDDAESCTAELANALGVDAILSGSIGHVGDMYQINVKIFSASGDARELAVASATAAEEADLLPSLDVIADQLATQVRKSMGRADPQAGRLRRLSWIPAAVGAAGGVAGAVFLVRSERASALLLAEPGGDPADTPINAADARRIRDDGASQQRLAQIGFAVGAAGIITAGLFYALGGAEPLEGTASVVVSPHGASLTVVY